MSVTMPYQHSSGTGVKDRITAVLMVMLHPCMNGGTVTIHCLCHFLKVYHSLPAMTLLAWPLPHRRCSTQRTRPTWPCTWSPLR
jgi:hypothetical protein